MYGRIFGKEQVGAVKRQIAVHFVRRYLMIARNAVLSARVHKHLSTENIRPQENFGIFDRAIDVAFRGKIHHHVGLSLLEKVINRFSVADIDLVERELRVLERGRKRRHIARVSQTINADYLVLGVLFQHMVHEVRADKACSAGNYYFHLIVLPGFARYFL